MCVQAPVRARLYVWVGVKNGIGHIGMETKAALGRKQGSFSDSELIVPTDRAVGEAQASFLTAVSTVASKGLIRGV